MSKTEQENQQKLSADFFGFIDSQNQKDELDPITTAVRNNILNQQMTMLSDWFKKDFPNQDINKENLKNYLNEDNIQKMSADANLKSRLENIEVKGYKSVLDNPDIKAKMQSLTWDSEQNEAKSKIIKNALNEEVCTLTETSKKVAFEAVNARGENIKIESYRSIDFPTQLNKETGPMHLALAVKDSNGNNIAEDKAVYFTAHYDKQGKLTEMSSPQPVKFMGKGDDAIGYIEHGGEIYTLPVTQGKYKEMTREVAKNNSIAVDVSQQLEIKEKAPLAKDLIVNSARPEIKKEQITEQQNSAPENSKQELATQELPEKKSIFGRVKGLIEKLMTKFKDDKQEINQVEGKSREAIDNSKLARKNGSMPNPNNEVLKKHLDDLAIKNQAVGDIENKYATQSDLEKAMQEIAQQKFNNKEQNATEQTQQQGAETKAKGELKRQISEGIIYSNMSLSPDQQKNSTKEVEKSTMEERAATVYQAMPSLEKRNTNKEVKQTKENEDKGWIFPADKGVGQASSEKPVESKEKEAALNKEIKQASDEFKEALARTKTRPRSKSESLSSQEKSGQSPDSSIKRPRTQSMSAIDKNKKKGREH